MDMADLKPICDLPTPPPRPADAHKGTFGTVIVVGGCETMIGAPALCARAALRTGAGLVKMAVPPAVLPAAITIEPSATGIGLGDDPTDAIALINQADPGGQAVLAVGPGMGQSDASGQLVHHILATPRTVVLDADGLNLLARSGKTHHADGPPLVLTPHPGEFARLARPLGITQSPTDPDQRPAAAAALAQAHHAVVVLKGRHTIITDGSRYRVNQTGNPALATAGTGDVLTGAIASLIAQGMTPFDAASLATHLHGAAADRWAMQSGPRGLRAQELADLLTEAMQEMEQTG